MTEPRKPWWKRKRWIAAAVLWLVIAYPLTMGPAQYGIRRGLLPSLVGLLYLPIWAALALTPDAAQELVIEGYAMPYLEWWDDLAQRHAANSL